MEYRLSQQQVRNIYNSTRITERVIKIGESIFRSGEGFRKEMAVSTLENLPNPGAIEKYANSLEEVGLGSEAEKLRVRYQQIQKFSMGDATIER